MSCCKIFSNQFKIQIKSGKAGGVLTSGGLGRGRQEFSVLLSESEYQTCKVTLKNIQLESEADINR